VTSSDPVTERLNAANPVPSVASFVPTTVEAIEFLAIVHKLDLTDHAVPEPSTTQHQADADWLGDDPEIFVLSQSDQSTVGDQRRWWPAIIGAVAATLLLVLGLVVMADRNIGDTEVDPAISPTVTSPAPSPSTTVVDAASSTILDSFGYRWSRVPHDDGVFNAHMQSVTDGGPGLVAVGDEGSEDGSWPVVWTSVDGVTWSRVPHDEAVFGGEDSQLMSDVVAGGPGLVAVGSTDSEDGLSAAVWTSVDGIAWSQVLDVEEVFSGAGMEAVTSGGPGLVAVGRSYFTRADGTDGNAAAVWTSTDGNVWSRVPQDEEAFGGPRNLGMHSVTAGGPGLVAVGSSDPHNGEDTAVWTSVDGIVWSRVPHDEEVFGGPGEQNMTDVTAGGPGLVAVGWEYGAGADAAVWTSVDGITWSRVSHDEDLFGGTSHQAMWGVTNIDGIGVVAVGEDRSRNYGDGEAAVWTSVDGITWTRGIPDEEVVGVGYPLSVTTGGPGLVAAGSEMVWVAKVDG
jgi:hypothetical protein